MGAGAGTSAGIYGAACGTPAHGAWYVIKGCTIAAYSKVYKVKSFDLVLAWNLQYKSKI